MTCVVYCAIAALVWQLMKAYTLSILTRLADTGHPIVDKEIVQWANQKVVHFIIFSSVCADNILRRIIFLFSSMSVAFC